MKKQIDIPVRLRGRYKMEAVKADGSRRLLADWFDNLITNNGLDIFASNASGSTWNTCYVGTGNTAPAFTDTALVTNIASTTTKQVTNSTNNGVSPYIGTMSITFRFAIGTATGNLSEVGVGLGPTNLFSRALILDGLGAPTTITVLSTEALDVTYQLQVYVPLVDVTGAIVINTVSYAYTLRAANAAGASWRGPDPFNRDIPGLSSITVTNGAIGAITAAPTGTSMSINTTQMTFPAYVNGNHFVDSVGNFGLVDGNLAGGVSAALLTYGRDHGTLGQFQISFTPALPKDASHTMALTFRLSWARH